MRRKGTDLRINNIIINGCQCGIDLSDKNNKDIEGGLLYGDNVHIWCGVYPNRLAALEEELTENSKALGDWWKNTTGIIGKRSYITLSNVFLDTIYNMLYTYAACTININNLITWEDKHFFINNGNLPDGFPTEGSLIKYADGSKTIGYLSINGGIIGHSLTHSNLFYYIASNEFIHSINNLRIIVPYAPSDQSKYIITSYYKYYLPLILYGYPNNYRKYIAPKGSNYYEIGRVLKNTGV